MTDDELKALFEAQRRESDAAHAETRRHFSVTAAELRDHVDAAAAETLRHFDVTAEHLDGRFAMLAELTGALDEKFERASRMSATSGASSAFAGRLARRW